MRLLLANPNTTEAVTEAITAAARAVAAPGTEIRPATARFGARVIATRTEAAVAEHAALDLLATESDGCDAAIIGASLDSGLRAAREMLAMPVLGLTESALHVACLTGVRFGAITTSGRSAAGLREMIALYGLAGRCAGIGALETSAGGILADPGAWEAGIVAEAGRLIGMGADCIVLIGAVMAPLPGRVQGRIAVPVLEGVRCAVVLAEGLVRLALPKAGAGSFAALPARETVGLSPALAARFAG